MKLTKDEVKHVAKLANLPLTGHQEEEYSNQLSKILDYVDKLNQVDTSNVKSTFNVSGQNSVMRKDEVGKSLSQKEALQNGSNIKNGLPAGRQGFFVTKGVFEDE